jgi:hypothetical protein
VVHRPLILAAALLSACASAPPDDDDATLDDDDAAPDDDDTAPDDDDATRDDDDTLDDDDEPVWPAPPNCPALWLHITREASVPAVADAMKLRVGAYRPEDIDTSTIPRAPEIASNTFHGLGPLEDAGDSYSIPLCVPVGEVVVAAMLDVNWDDDTCTPGDLLGYGQGVFSVDGDVIEIVLDRVLTEEACGHGHG